MKYSGLIPIVLMFATLFYNGNKLLEFDNQSQASGYSAGDIQLSPLIQKAEVFSKKSYQLEELIVMLDELNEATPLSIKYSDIISLPVVDDIPQEAVAAPVKRKRNIQHNYVLTMVFVSPSDKYAVIDGKLVREGETLSNGEKLLSISRGSVTISKKGGNQTVRITDS